MILLIIASILIATTNCYAGEWIFAARSDEDNNITMEVKEGNIESISSSIVRAQTRMIRSDPSIERFGTYPKDFKSAEAIVDFDCSKRRHKVLQTIQITYTRIQPLPNPAPSFEKTYDMSLFGYARQIVCKHEGKMK